MNWREVCRKYTRHDYGKHFDPVTGLLLPAMVTVTLNHRKTEVTERSTCWRCNTTRIRVFDPVTFQRISPIRYRWEES